MRKTLLLCGILSSLAYVAINVFVAGRAEGYSSISQTVSELSAIDAPTRSLWVTLCTIYGVLLIAFGYGIWLSARDSRPLRMAGALVIAHGVFGFFWPPMHQRTVLAAGGGSLTDTLHIAWTFVTVVLMMLAIGFAAAALDRRFRIYSVVTTVLLIAFGAVTGTYAPGIEANLPTPWVGVWERFDISLFLLWVAVLAMALWRPRDELASVPGSINERGYHRLGGIDQWVVIRGESAGNPVLICLHGGPGFSETWLLRYFNATLEKHFTVVYWDQRGAGKSYHADIPRSSMNIEQFISDLDELVDMVRRRFDKNTVTIFGHSWGSALGALYAGRFPGKVAAYIGGAQIGDAAAAESASYAYAISEATRLGNRRALKALRTIGPPPYDSRSVFAERTWIQRLDGQFRPGALWNMGRIVFGGPDSSVFDLPKIVRGFRFSLDAMNAEVSTLNLLTAVPALQVPVFFFLGGRDHWVPPETSLVYFNALSAPSKELVWFERSGHEMFADEPEKFNRVMVELVRPVAAASPYNAPHAQDSSHSPGTRSISPGAAA